ncbi:11187_t:CDS:2 [Paraglomus occultum]|uniref:11187_t:CDS:1 n=1 Tax=Paraglomus occultum TaxID=144539 RepID=A0A9N9FBT3_9GLOM|nr:11187_t:CDS:2 [Paraglomus occultum]
MGNIASVISTKRRRRHTLSPSQDIDTLSQLHRPSPAELDRLRLQHLIVKTVWQGNFSSPCHEILRSGCARILNVGCRPGTWINDTAFEYPEAHFVGVDVLPENLFEQSHFNVEFKQTKSLTKLPFESSTFNFVTMSFLMLQVSNEEYAEVVKECVRMLKPGGWIEIMEIDSGLQNPGPATAEVIKTCKCLFNVRYCGSNSTAYCFQKVRSKNRDPCIASSVEIFLKETGKLSRIQHETRDWPLGSWAGKFGNMSNATANEIFVDYAKQFAMSITSEPEELEELAKNYLLEWETNRSSVRMNRFYAQKQ